MNNEIWKDVPGFVGLYQVSNLGRVKSIGRYDCMKRYWPERILKTQKTKDGYTRVFVCKDGKINFLLTVYKFDDYKVTVTGNVYRLVAWRKAGKPGTNGKAMNVTHVVTVVE